MSGDVSSYGTPCLLGCRTLLTQHPQEYPSQCEVPVSALMVRFHGAIPCMLFLDGLLSCPKRRMKLFATKVSANNRVFYPHPTLPSSSTPLDIHDDIPRLKTEAITLGSSRQALWTDVPPWLS